MIKLNYLIFNEISIYLSYKCNFKEILEFSLISKSAFKLFQNIISTNCKLANIELPIISLYNYIKKCNNNNNNNQYKLIDINKITFIQSKLPTTIKNDMMMIEQIKMKCKNLKSILWLNNFKIPINEISIDHSINGFFKFNEISISWDIFHTPVSSEKEEEELRNSHSFDYSLFPYSFKFLNFYTDNLKKLNITSSVGSGGGGGSGGDDSLIIYNLNNLLNYCYNLNSIKFKSHACPPLFLSKLLSSPGGNCKNLTSLFIGIDDYHDSDNRSTRQSRLDLIENNNNLKLKRDKFLINTFSNSNNNLKKLIIKDICILDLKRFIQSIVNGNKNKSLESIGLLFNHKISNGSYITIDTFEPLSKLPLLKSLTCEISNLDIFILFIKRYSNILKINTLKIVIKSSSALIITHSFHKFLSFIKENSIHFSNLHTVKLIDPLYLIGESTKSNLRNYFKIENKITLISKNNENSFEDYYY